MQAPGRKPGDTASRRRPSAMPHGCRGVFGICARSAWGPGTGATRSPPAAAGGLKKDGAQHQKAQARGMWIVTSISYRATAAISHPHSRRSRSGLPHARQTSTSCRVCLGRPPPAGHHPALRAWRVFVSRRCIPKEAPSASAGNADGHFDQLSRDRRDQPPAFPSLALRASSCTANLDIVSSLPWPASAGWTPPGPPGLARLRESTLHPEGSPKRKRGECGWSLRSAIARPPRSATRIPVARAPGFPCTADRRTLGVRHVGPRPPGAGMPRRP